MIVLGLLFILVAVGATAVAITTSSGTSVVVPVSGFGVSFAATPMFMFVAGALSVVLVVLGFVLMSGGARRFVRSRQELRRLRRAEAEAGGVTTDPVGSSRRDLRARETSGDNAAAGTIDRRASAGPEGSADTSTGGGAGTG